MKFKSRQEQILVLENKEIKEYSIVIKPNDKYIGDLLVLLTTIHIMFVLY